jgi:hypothetical protein
MSPARRAGAGWGRHGPGAPPPPASPPPTNWGRVSSWTATDLIPRMDLLRLSEWWVSWQLLLKLPLQLETSQSQVQVEAPHWQWAWRQSLTRTAQVGHLIMASFSQGHSQSVRGPGQGSQESGPDTWSQWLEAVSALLWQLPVTQAWARARHCTSANNCDTTPYGAIAKIFNLIQY